MDCKRVEDLIYELLLELGHDPEENPGSKDTPKRVAKFYKEWMMDASPPEMTCFENPAPEDSEMVIISEIPFYSLCEHHMLPFFGTATVGYIPAEEIAGLSKLPRAVQYVASGLRTQEQIGALLMRYLEENVPGALGFAASLKAEHLCMSMRGVKAHGALTTTTHLSGVFKEDEMVRSEFLDRIK